MKSWPQPELAMNAAGLHGLRRRLLVKVEAAPRFHGYVNPRSGALLGRQSRVVCQEWQPMNLRQGRLSQSLTRSGLGWPLACRGISTRPSCLEAIVNPTDASRAAHKAATRGRLVVRAVAGHHVTEEATAPSTVALIITGNPAAVAGGASGP